jgi:hypothetical protein
LADIEAVLQAIKTLQQTLEPLSPKARELALDILFRVLGITAPVPERAARPIGLHTAPHPPLQSSACLQPIAPILVDNLVMLAKAYAELNGVKLTTVGTNSTQTSSFYVDLQHAPKGRDEPASCTLKKYDTLTKWFSDNWPEGSEMPTPKDPEHYSNGEVKNVVKTQKLRRSKRRPGQNRQH